MAFGTRLKPARPRLLLYAHIQDPALFSLLEFYSEEMHSLAELGMQITTETHLWPAIRGRQDLCLAYWPASALPVVLAWRLRRRPVVVTGAIHDADVSGSRTRRLLKFIVTCGTLRLATGAIALSKFEAAQMARLHPTRLAMIYPSVDTAYFRPGIKNTVPSAVIVAQLNRASLLRKGVDVAIAATGMVRESVPGFRLYVVGPIHPDGAEELQSLQQSLDFDGVVLCGQLDRHRKRALLASSWAYLQPSIVEGFGMAVAEAMSCGTVPICSSNGALPEVVGKAGILSEARTAEAISRHVVEVVEHEQMRRHLEAAARARALDKFSRAARVKEIRELLDAWGLKPGGERVRQR